MNETSYFSQSGQDKWNEETAVPPPLDNAALIRLMHCLASTQENACSCDETFALLDQYVELIVSEEQMTQLMPLVQNHMIICGDCREEFEILLNILQSEATST